ncbi:mitochondrial import inner membrane translocase subunit tim44 [Clonorchis sinensis]|uniref:Mitochondrial import inner membrane translocase subunit tim44 n=1 Tax=Clonorchis sinensis TaxID=79923 RepID=G7YKW1_CLOSI|nr:mitochondrial import inner membrane translocase subunit tim44 [Clonorchis sinensis]
MFNTLNPQRKIEKELPTDAVEKIRVRLNVLSDKLKEGGQQLAMNESLKKSLENLSKAGEQMKDVTKSLGDSEFLKIALKVEFRPLLGHYL